jgi:hypothetical protein
MSLMTAWLCRLEVIISAFLTSKHYNACHNLDPEAFPTWQKRY